jgi:hypothetical protein
LPGTEKESAFVNDSQKEGLLFHEILDAAFQDRALEQPERGQETQSEASSA